MTKGKEWKENAIEQSLKRIIDCIHDNITEELSRSKSYRFYPKVEEQVERGTLVSYPGDLLLTDTVSVSNEQIDLLEKIVQDKGLITEFSKIAKKARKKKPFEFKTWRFINKLLTEGVDKAKLISTAIDEVLERPSTWYVKAHIYGLSTNNSEFALDQLTLRAPATVDFPIFVGPRRDDDVYAGYDASHFSDPDDIPRFRRWEQIHSIAEWNASNLPKKRDVENEIRSEVERVLQELRLIKSERFLVPKWNAYTDSAVADPIHIRESGILSSRLTGFRSITEFSEKDAKKFNLIARPVLRKEITEKDLKRRVLRARSMYNLSCERSDIESVLFAVIGLETLYLDGSQEMRYKLAFRAATALSKLWGEGGDIIYSLISKAYNIRSLFVHGKSLNKFERDIDKILHDLREYLRCSILIWLGGVLKDNATSEKLRLNIDLLPFDDEAKNNFDDFISTVLY